LEVSHINEVTHATREQYHAIATRIISSFTRQSRVDPSDNESTFITWLTKYASRVTHSTWRLYRAALVMEFRDVFSQSRLAEMIRVLKVKSHDVNGIHSSAGKAKRISERSLQSFEVFAEEMNNALNEPCLMCIKASILCGLRPIEWSQSRVLERTIDEANETCEFILEIKNAKATQGRSHGVYRTILFTNVTMEGLAHVEYMLHLGEREDYVTLLRRMSSRLSEVNNILFGRVKGKGGVRQNGIGLSLYAGRHQFAADAKAAKLSPFEIAALMGHGSIDTAFDYYGKKGHGREYNFRARPYQKDLDSVERLNSGHPRRQNRDWSKGFIMGIEKDGQAVVIETPPESQKEVPDES